MYRKTVICSGFNLSNVGRFQNACASVPNAHPSHRALVFSCANLETRGLEPYSPCSSFQPQPAVALELILNLSPSALRCQCSPKATATAMPESRLAQIALIAGATAAAMLMLKLKYLNQRLRSAHDEVSLTNSPLPHCRHNGALIDWRNQI